MSEIEEEIRRQMIAERYAARAAEAARSRTPDQEPPPRQSKLQAAKSQGGWIGALAALALLLAKFWGPLLLLLSKLKFLALFKTFFITGGTMIASMWAWSTVFGWTFAVGFVILILVHESGHAIAGKALGHKVGPMVFVPFMGAFVSIGHTRNIVEDAHIGIMGPVFGTLGGLACLAIYQLSPSPYWLALANVTFFMNLFNLLPMPPLDGSWITPLISPKLLVAGVILLFVVAPSNPMIWILGLLSIPRIIQGWKAKGSDPFYQAPAAARWKYGLAYVGLAAFLALSNMMLHDELRSHRRTPQAAIARLDLEQRS
jgi:Zn-dependent protease